MKPNTSNVINFATMKRRPVVAQSMLDELFTHFEVSALRQRYAGQRIRIVDKSGTTYGIIWDFFNVVDHYAGRDDRMELGVIYTDSDYALPAMDAYEYVTISPRPTEISFDKKVLVGAKPKKAYRNNEVSEYIYFKS